MPTKETVAAEPSVNANSGIFGSYDDVSSAAKKIEDLAAPEEYVEKDKRPDHETAPQDGTTEEEGKERKDTSEEQPEEEAQVEVEAEGSEGDPDYYAVKIDGEEMEVTLDELTSNYQKGTDYTKKTQKLADENRKVADMQNYLVQQSHAYTNQLETLRDNLNREVESKYEPAEMERLRVEEPMEYFARRDDMRELENHQRQVNDAIQAETRSQQAVLQQNQAEHLRLEQEKLLTAIPEWVDGAKGKEMRNELRTYGISQGFKEEEMDTVTDHRSILILRDAMLYNKMKDSTDIKAKQVRKAPKVRKTKAADMRKLSKSETQQRKRQQLKHSGATEDAARLLYEMDL